MGPARSARTLLRLNQAEGFDCMSCAWPDPDVGHRHTAESPTSKSVVIRLERPGASGEPGGDEQDPVRADEGHKDRPQPEHIS